MALTQQDFLDIEAILGRKPTKVEEIIFDTMWSEHCSYKSSKTTLKTYLGPKTSGSDVVIGIGQDAGVIRLAEHEGKSYCLTVAHESHNHPSQILPIEGAATGVGGVVRDVYCMGADVIGVLNSLHFGLVTPDSHNAFVEEIAEKVVIGVSDYANPLGVPVLGGETLYHESYNDNCLVNVAALGIVQEDQVIHSRVPEEARTTPYVMILVGKSTDSTGFGGASFSSATLDTESNNIGAVQVHDPFLKRVLAEAIKEMFRVVHRDGLKIGFKDLGAGGIACATSEIAAASGFGVDLDLEKVNTAFENLSPEVITCSETQERFCIAVPESVAEKIVSIFNVEFELPKLYHKAGAVVIGKITTDPYYRVFSTGELLCNLPIQAITTDVFRERTSTPRQIVRTAQPATYDVSKTTIEKQCLDLLALPNIRSKRYVYRHFDNAVRGDTVFYPGEADSVVITPIEGSPVGVAVSIDSNLYGYYDPYMCGASAVAESVRNVVCVGGKPIALTDCLNYGNPENPSAFFDFEEGVKGIADAVTAFSFTPGEPLPIVSGNVSFYNDSKQGAAITPSPVVVVVAKIDDYHRAITMQLKSAGHTLILVGTRYPEFGGTQIGNLVNGLNDVAPQVRFEDEAKMNRAIYELIQVGALSACHDISAGGFFACLSEMVMGEKGRDKCGAEIRIPESADAFTFLFSENGGYLIEVAADQVSAVEARLQADRITFSQVGQTTKDGGIQVSYSHGQVGFSADALRGAWAPEFS